MINSGYDSYLRLIGQWVLIGFLSILVMGCKGSTHVASIDQLGQPPSIKINQHTVFRGDTLYSIAWRYGMDYRQIARINNIRAPYTIYTGQKLNLGGNQSSVSNQREMSVANGAVAVPDNGYDAKNGGVREISATQQVVSVSPSTSVRSDNGVTGQSSSESKAGIPKTSAQPAARTQTNATAGKWVWPTQGRLIKRFSSGDSLQKGIDIEASPGTSITAAAAGSVVYAGNGLAGYGELLIIKHDEQFLSAYAHNSKLLVAEGDTVRSGQLIAEMGSSGTDKTKLHFEIRQDGKPVDPLLYLPKR